MPHYDSGALRYSYLLKALLDAAVYAVLRADKLVNVPCDKLNLRDRGNRSKCFTPESHASYMLYVIGSLKL